MIHYIKHCNIDKHRWDAALERSQNRLVYAASWYLDIVAPNWEALIDDDYEAIMPLPAKKKYGIPYLIQPKFVQQLGIFSHKTIDTNLAKAFVNAIPIKFVWQCFNWNSNNPVSDFRGFSVRNNYELSLQNTYESISYNYIGNVRRNIKEALKANITPKLKNSTDSYIELFNRYAKISPNKETIMQLEQILKASFSKNFGEIVFAYNDKNEIVAGAFFLKCFNRIIYHNSFVTNEGYKKSAMYIIINEVIKQNSSTNFLFDFEGSMIPGIASFFEGFGSTKNEYFEYRKTVFTN